MPITKTQLKQIAADAWTDRYNNINSCKNYKVKISGNQKVIKNILDVLADEMNGRYDNRDYMCGYDQYGDMYSFFVMENERLAGCYEFDEDADDEIVADDAEVIDDSDDEEEATSDSKEDN